MPKPYEWVKVSSFEFDSARRYAAIVLPDGLIYAHWRDGRSREASSDDDEKTCYVERTGASGQMPVGLVLDHVLHQGEYGLRFGQPTGVGTLLRLPYTTGDQRPRAGARLVPDQPRTRLPLYEHRVDRRSRGLQRRLRHQLADHPAAGADTAVLSGAAHRSRHP